MLFLGTETPACAQGSIVYHAPVNVSLYSAGGTPYTYGIDMNSDGTEDFVFRAYTSFAIYSTTGGLTVGIPKGGNDVGNWSIPLLDGYSIGPFLDDPLQWTSSYQAAFPPDYWIGASLHVSNDLGIYGYWVTPIGTFLTASVGVQFTLEDGAHYGWIRVSTPAIVNGGVIEDWAYNSVPGQPILAGQVPEPSTWILLTGGIMLLAFRQSRWVPSLVSSG